MGWSQQLCEIVKRRRVPYCDYKQFLLSDHSGAGNADPCNFSGMSFKYKGCTALVSYSIIFKTLFAYDGYINSVLLKLGLIGERINWLGDVHTAKAIIILALIWRWTGYNMVFYLA